MLDLRRKRRFSQTSFFFKNIYKSLAFFLKLLYNNIMPLW